MKAVCVYCGSSMGASPVYADAARAFGRALVEADLSLVYGGGHVGLMGVIADEVLALGGRAVGVIPELLFEKEVAHTSLTELHVVRTMHERKAQMAKLADAFLILPGGYGTLEELLEVVTWAQLRIHNKPVVLINIVGYWDGLLAFLDTAVAAGFLKPKNRELLWVAADANEAIALTVDSQSGSFD